MACSGIHCDGCGSCGGGGRAVAVVVAAAAVAAFGSAVAAVVADLITAALIVTSLATMAMVTVLAVKMRRGDRRMVQWHRPAVLPAAAPVKAISGKQAGVYVITSRAEQMREPRR
jgi:ABC-type Na+ efflux pump permease subunit